MINDKLRDILVRAIHSWLEDGITVDFFMSEEVLIVAGISFEELEDLKQKSNKQTEDEINKLLESKLNRDKN